MICSFNFLIFLAVCLNIFIVINIKIFKNSNQQNQSYKFNSHIAAFLLCGFDHRDAWNLHTNIKWSKRSTDFKELSPCSVWFPLVFFIWVYFILVNKISFFPLYRIVVYSGFSFDRFIQDCGLFRVQFWQVYTGLWFIQGSVLTGLYRIVVYSGFSFDRFIQDCGLFRVQFWQVYTGLWFIQDSVLTG